VFCNKNMTDEVSSRYLAFAWLGCMHVVGVSNNGNPPVILWSIVPVFLLYQLVSFLTNIEHSPHTSKWRFKFSPSYDGIIRLQWRPFTWNLHLAMHVNGNHTRRGCPVTTNFFTQAQLRIEWSSKTIRRLKANKKLNAGRDRQHKYPIGKWL